MSDIFIDTFHGIDFMQGLFMLFVLIVMAALPCMGYKKIALDASRGGAKVVRIGCGVIDRDRIILCEE